MKTSTRIVLALALGMLFLAFALPTFATVAPPALTITDGTNTVTMDQTGIATFSTPCTNCVTQGSGASPGALTWAGTLGPFTIIASASTKPALTGAPKMDLDVRVITGPVGGTVTAMWSTTGFNTPAIIGAHMLTTGKAVNGSTSGSAYSDDSNTLFGTTNATSTLLVSDGPFSTAIFTGDKSTTNHPNGALYSVTEVAVFNVRANANVEGDYNIQLLPSPLALTCPATVGQVGQEYKSALVATGGVPSYTFSIISGSLPPGLGLDTNSGAITGTPKLPAGAYGFTAQVVDSSGGAADTQTTDCTITTNQLTYSVSGCAYQDNNLDAIFEQPPDLPLANVEITLDCNGVGPYTTTTDNNGLYRFDGLSAGTYCVSAPAGVHDLVLGDLLLWTAGSLNATVPSTSPNGPDSVNNCFGYIKPPSATCLVLTDLVQGVNFNSGPMQGSGGTGGPYTFASMDLPAGLQMGTDGHIYGTPTVSGNFTYHVTVTDKDGHTGTIGCSITIAPPPSATCLVISNLVQGVPMTPTGPMTGSGGTGGPYTFASTDLPAGLHMGTDGHIYGTPTVSGTFTYHVTVTDKDGHTGTIGCSITIAPPPQPPNITLTKTAKPTSAMPFGQVSYTYIVTNTGGTTLTNIKVTDDNGTPGYTDDDFVVGTIASLGPGLSQTFTVTLIPAINECATVNSVPSTAAGLLITQLLPSGDLKITFRQSTAIVDNTYGANAVGWKNGHKFSDLTQSDMAEFQIYDGKGNKVLDFQFDYASASSSYPSGYGTLGASGGDGKLITGNASWILGVLSPATLSDGSVVRSTTTLTTNLNQSPDYYGYTTNSPSPTDPDYPGWDAVDGYTVYISKSAFGSNGFGKVVIPLVHNSPPKIGTGAIYPTPCGSYKVTNTATVTGYYGNIQLSATATATVNEGTSTPPPSPGVTLTKKASVSSTVPNTPVTYTYVATNNGSVTLTNVQVIDDNATPDDTSDDIVVGTAATLPPGGSATFTRTLVPVSTPGSATYCQNINGTNTIIGTLVVDQLPAGAVLPQGNVVGSLGATRVIFNQSTGVVDNNYGTTASSANGWPSGHKFSDFTGSDMAEFRFTDNTGKAVLDIGIDYLSSGTTATYYTSTGTAKTVTYPAAYGSLGTVGDGKVYLGSATDVLYYTTTMTTNLNQSSAYYGFTTNSPAPSNPLYGGWNIVDGYTLVIDNSAFGTAGFGGVTVPVVHDSPSKISGIIKFTPTACGSASINNAVLVDDQKIGASATATVNILTTTVSSPFVTVSPSGWGASPTSTNAAGLLADNFTAVYGTAGVKIGGPPTITFTTALAIQNFLPQGGTPAKLTKTYTLTGGTSDVATTEAGSLAGEVLALKLNVDFSAKGLLPAGFGNVKPYTSGSFANQTVSQILTTANKVLGGGAPPPGVTLSSLNATLDAINNMYPPQ